LVKGIEFRAHNNRINRNNKKPLLIIMSRNYLKDNQQWSISLSILYAFKIDFHYVILPDNINQLIAMAADHVL